MHGEEGVKSKRERSKENRREGEARRVGRRERRRGRARREEDSKELYNTFKSASQTVEHML